MKKSSMDLTQGNIIRLILVFASPIFVGQVFQNLYNSADAIVVGHFVGTTALAAVSSCSDISFLLTVFLVFGCVFELPVISVVLTWLGVIRSSWLKKARKPAIVLIFLVSAIITPPDVVSQIMVALPMILLFQLGIFLSSLCEKSKKKSAAEEDAEEETV